MRIILLTFLLITAVTALAAEAADSTAAWIDSTGIFNYDMPLNGWKMYLNRAECVDRDAACRFLSVIALVFISFQNNWISSTTGDAEYFIDRTNIIGVTYPGNCVTVVLYYSLGPLREEYTKPYLDLQEAEQMIDDIYLKISSDSSVFTIP